MLSLIGRLAVVILCAWAGSGLDARAQSRPLSIDDVLAMETFGTVAISPDGRWAVHERRGPYHTAPRFDRGHRSSWAITDLWLSDLDVGGDSERLVQGVTAGGLLIGSWSPKGKRLMVYRLTDDRLEPGIVTMADRSLRWTGLAADLAVTGATSAWLDDDRLVLTVREAGDLPWMLRFDGTGSVEMQDRWALSTAGAQPSRLIVDTTAGVLTTNAPPPLLQVVLIDARLPGMRSLAKGTIRDFAVSPDGHWVGVLTSAQPVALDPSQPVVQSPVLNRSRLTLIQADSGREVSLDADLDVAPHLLSWSDRSHAVLVWARRDGEPWAHGSLHEVRVDGAMARPNHDGLEPLAGGRVIDEFQAVKAGWVGDDPVLYARAAPSERFDWWRLEPAGPVPLTAGLRQAPTRLAAITRSGSLAFADGGLWLLDAQGDMSRLTLADESVAEGQRESVMQPIRLRLNDPPRRDWAVAIEGTSVTVRDQYGHDLVRASTGSCPGIPFLRAVSMRRVAMVCVDQGVETLSVIDATGVRELSRANRAFETIDVPRPRPVPHLDRLGRPTTSWLYLPSDRAASEVKGVLVVVYPGGGDDGRYVEATSFMRGPRPQLLTTGGYAVLSASFPDEAQSERSAMVADFAIGIDLAVDAALAAVPELPANRTVLIGHSFGGYAALAVATRSQRYRGYIASAAPTDLVSGWGEFLSQSRIWPSEWFTLNQKIGGVESGQAATGGPPWGDLAGYATASPFLQADKIRAPVLLITADRDYVSHTQSEHMLSALHRQGRSARLLLYWGEGHLFSSPANIADVYEQMFDWLSLTLDGPQAASSSRGHPSAGPSPRTLR